MIIHPEDHLRQPIPHVASHPEVIEGYNLGLDRNVYPVEPVGSAGGYKTRRSQPEQRRMAGDALNLDLKQSLGTPKYVPLPDIGAAELRTPGLPQ
jgi:hypothetical protein